MGEKNNHQIDIFHACIKENQLENLLQWEQFVRFWRWLCWEDLWYECMFDHLSSQKLLINLVCHKIEIYLGACCVGLPDKPSEASTLNRASIGV